MRDKVLILRSFKLSMNQKLSIFPAQFEHLTLNLFNCCETNSLSLNHGWLLNEKQQFTPLALKSCLSCRSVSVSCECCSSLKYLIFGTKLDRTKKVHISCFFQPSFVFYFSTWPLSLVQTNLKIHNVFFVCSSMFSSRTQVFKYLDIAIQPIIHNPLVRHYKNILIYTVDSATKLLATGTTELVCSILGEFQDSS